MVNGLEMERRTCLYHLGVQALSYLGASVRHEHRAVPVDLDQSTGLIHKDGSERDEILCRDDGHASLLPSVKLVVLSHLLHLLGVSTEGNQSYQCDATTDCLSRQGHNLL